MCFQSIYNRLREDFNFLNKYGYEFYRAHKHYVNPSISFKKDNNLIIIGFSYEEHRFFVTFYDNNEYKTPIYIVGDKTLLQGKNYKMQIENVKNELIIFLDTRL